jgi:hypothetical protein
MKHPVFTHRSWALALGVVIALLAAGSAQATTATTTSCTQPVMYQPFLPFNDGNWYSLLPGESYDNFPATGWTLSNGATLTTTTLQDGSVGSVLNLKTGAKAVSPAVCVNNTYPYMRAMLHSVYAGSVNTSIAFLTTTGWRSPQSVGSVTTSAAGWVLTGDINLASGPYTGWSYAQITFLGGGSKVGADSQLYNVFYDPRMK